MPSYPGALPLLVSFRALFIVRGPCNSSLTGLVESLWHAFQSADPCWLRRLQKCSFQCSMVSFISVHSLLLSADFTGALLTTLVETPGRRKPARWKNEQAFFTPTFLGLPLPGWAVLSLKRDAQTLTELPQPCCCIGPKFQTSKCCSISYVRPEAVAL